MMAVADNGSGIWWLLTMAYDGSGRHWLKMAVADDDGSGWREWSAYRAVARHPRPSPTTCLPQHVISLNDPFWSISSSAIFTPVVCTLMYPWQSSGTAPQAFSNNLSSSTFNLYEYQWQWLTMVYDGTPGLLQQLVFLNMSSLWIPPTPSMSPSISSYAIFTPAVS